MLTFLCLDQASGHRDCMLLLGSVCHFTFTDFLLLNNPEQTIHTVLEIMAVVHPVHTTARKELWWRRPNLSRTSPYLLLRTLELYESIPVAVLPVDIWAVIARGKLNLMDNCLSIPDSYMAFTAPASFTFQIIFCSSHSHTHWWLVILGTQLGFLKGEREMHLPQKLNHFLGATLLLSWSWEGFLRLFSQLKEGS